MPPPRNDIRNDNETTTACPVCGDPFTPIRRQRYCTPACRQAAWRARHPTTPNPSSPCPPRTRRRDITVYQCPECDTRYLGQQWCHDCHPPAPASTSAAYAPTATNPSRSATSSTNTPHAADQHEHGRLVTRPNRVRSTHSRRSTPQSRVQTQHPAAELRARSTSHPTSRTKTRYSSRKNIPSCWRRTARRVFACHPGVLVDHDNGPAQRPRHSLGTPQAPRDPELTLRIAQLLAVAAEGGAAHRRAGDPHPAGQQHRRGPVDRRRVPRRLARGPHETVTRRAPLVRAQHAGAPQNPTWERSPCTRYDRSTSRSVIQNLIDGYLYDAR